MYSIRYYYQYFIYGIKNLISYFSIVWNDRDWDQYYFYRLLQFKLKRIRDRMNLGLFEGSELIASDIDTAIQALERILNDNYCENEWKHIENTYGKLVFKNGTIVREKVLTEEMQEKEKEDVFNISKLEYDRKTNDINLVFDTIKENVEKWWD